MSTYGKTIEDAMTAVTQLNNTVEWLRDIGDLSEKNLYNATRQALFNAEGYLRQLLDKLPPDRYNMEID